MVSEGETKADEIHKYLLDVIDAWDYWHERSKMWEERLHREVSKTARLRAVKRLGMGLLPWRTRRQRP